MIYKKSLSVPVFVIGVWIQTASAAGGSLDAISIGFQPHNDTSKYYAVSVTSQSAEFNCRYKFMEKVIRPITKDTSLMNLEYFAFNHNNDTNIEVDALEIDEANSTAKWCKLSFKNNGKTETQVQSIKNGNYLSSLSIDMRYLALEPAYSARKAKASNKETGVWRDLDEDGDYLSEEVEVDKYKPPKLSYNCNAHYDTEKLYLFSILAFNKKNKQEIVQEELVLPGPNERFTIGVLCSTNFCCVDYSYIKIEVTEFTKAEPSDNFKIVRKFFMDLYEDLTKYDPVNMRDIKKLRGLGEEAPANIVKEDTGGKRKTKTINWLSIDLASMKVKIKYR